MRSSGGSGAQPPFLSREATAGNQEPSTALIGEALRAVCAVGLGEEPSGEHRVVPWSSVLSVEVVPLLSGGDMPERAQAPSAG